MAMNEATNNKSIGFFHGATELVEKLLNTGKQMQQHATEAENAITEIDGAKFYWDRNNHQYREIKARIPEDAPVPEPLAMFTLDGVIDYIRENAEGLIPADNGRLILHVVDPFTVRLLSHPSEHRKDRSVIVGATAHHPSIRFDSYMENEIFCTMLLSNFIETEARENLFQVVKSMTKEQNLNTADDGVSQVITVKQGVSLAANVKFKNPVPLIPMRTFTEIDQPESNFTLRVDEHARVALFEADGGAWKNEAVSRIKEYLRNNLEGYPVVVFA